MTVVYEKPTILITQDGISGNRANAFIDEMNAGVAATSADRVQTGLDRAATAADVMLTHTDVLAAEAAAGRVDLGALDAAIAATAADVILTHADVIAAEAARDAAIAGSILTWPTTAAGIGPGIAGVTSIVAGSGGANGTFALAYSGGTQVLAPVGVFTVAGGALVSVTITYPGYYSAGTPTLSFAASAGLTGASATAVMAANTPVNGFFAVPSAVTGEAAIIYKNVAGVATEVVRTPSTARISQIVDHLAIWNGTDNDVPVITDTDGTVLLSVNKVTGRVNVPGVMLDDEFDNDGLSRYTGSGPIYPLMTDAGGRVLLGWDEDNSAPVGPMAGVTTYAAAARVPLAVPVVAAAKNHLIGYGQSLAVGAAGGAVLSATQPYSNVTFNGGPRAWTGTVSDYSAFKALVEDAVSPAPDGGTNRTETICSGAANYASTLMALDGTDPSSHVILASTAGRGGSLISQLVGGTSWYNTYFMGHMNGANALEASYNVQAVMWLQGEQDVSAATSYATYRAALAGLQSRIETDAKAITGQTHPVYMLSYQTSWGAATFSDIALAQLNLCQTSDRFHFVAPTYVFPHAVDAVHLTNIGYKWLGAYFGRAYKSLIDGFAPQWLRPVSATRRGAVVRVRMDAPQLPLVLDAVNLAPTTNSGFKVLDGASSATISSIVVDGADVVITLSAVPSGAVTVRYALDYLGAGLIVANGASGNLRDSTADAITIASAEYPLWHVAPAFQLTAIALGE